MGVRGLGISAHQALRGVLAASLLLMLGANLPGHMSYDSVAQLYEGHFHIRETWGPAIYAWILGLVDAVIPGASVLVCITGLVFFGSLAGLAALRGRVTWLAVAFAAAMALTPQILIFQGTVWKDLTFVDGSVGGAVCLAHAFARWNKPRVRWPWLAGSLFLFAIASMVRQNGILIPAAASLALGIVGSRGQWRWFATWMGGSLLALVALIQLLTVFAVPQFGAKDGGLQVGVRIVQNYDLTAAVSLDPNYHLKFIGKYDPAAAVTIHDRAPNNWSPDRVDYLDNDPVLGVALNKTPQAVAQRQWLDLIFNHPSLYLRVRWSEFRWVFLTPIVDRCLPVFTGVDAPIAKMNGLRLPRRFSPADQQLANYDSYFLDTPVQMHWPYALAALVTLVLTLRRRDHVDLAVASLMLGALAVTASFFIITIACDYRYLLVIDVTGMVGVFYLLLDPGGFLRRRVPPAATPAAG